MPDTPSINDMLIITPAIDGNVPQVFVSVAMEYASRNGNTYQVGPFSPSEARQIAANLIEDAATAERNAYPESVSGDELPYNDVATVHIPSGRSD